MTKTIRRNRRRFWSLVRFTIFLLLITTVSVLAVNKFFFDNKEESKIVAVPQGVITIINLDTETDLPIKAAEFKILADDSDEVIEVLYTDEEGKVISSLLDYNTSYKIEQTFAPMPYKLTINEIVIEISEENHEIIVKNGFFPHIKETHRLEDGTIKATKVDIPVEVLMQNPELPNGCEITSLTAVLNYYGYGVSKTEMADMYLPQESFVRRNDKLMGANPYKAFAGNPRDQSGFFVYPPPVVKATNDYLSKVNGTNIAKDVSGSTMEEMLRYLDEGYPVVTWVTLDLSKPRLNYSWYLIDSNEKFLAPVNLHAVVLKGYDSQNVYYMDPLKGYISRNVVEFFQSYYDLGKHAIIIEANI